MDTAIGILLGRQRLPNCCTIGWVQCETSVVEAGGRRVRGPAWCHVRPPPTAPSRRRSRARGLRRGAVAHTQKSCQKEVSCPQSPVSGAMSPVNTEWPSIGRTYGHACGRERVTSDRHACAEPVNRLEVAQLPGPQCEQVHSVTR